MTDPKTKLALCSLIVAGITLLLVGVVYSANQLDTKYTISVILYYPSDVTPNLAYADVINESVENVREWYRLQLGRTFTYTPVEVVVGAHDSEWYETMGKSLEIHNELINKGYDFSPNKGYLIFADIEMISHVRNLGDNVCYYGRHVPYSLVVGSIRGIDTLTKAIRGTIAHEIGHAFGGLPHLPSGSNDIMSGNSRYYPNVSFSENEKSNLLKSSFLTMGVFND